MLARVLVVGALGAFASAAGADPVAAVERAAGPESRTCGSAAFSRPVGGGLRAGHDVAAGGLVDGNGAGAHAVATLDLGASLAFDAGSCPRAQELDLSLRSTPRWSSALGVTSLDARGELRFGPVPHVDPSLGVVAWTLTSWELSLDASWRAQPRLFDRHDLARDLFDRFAVAGATRAVRIALADVCRPDDRRPECADGRGPRTPLPLTLDLVTVDVTAGLTEQGARRDDAAGTMSLMRVEGHQVDGYPIDARVDVLRVQREVVTVGGVEGAIESVWPVYLETTNPTTGTRYVIGWGRMTAFELDDGTDPLGDHRTLTERDLGGIGVTGGGLARGAGLGWQRTAYVTMAAEPVLEDRITAEGWTPVDGVATRARAFAARLERLAPTDRQPAVEWTGGVEVGGARRVGALDVDITAEVGRSYHGAVDGEPARAGLGARVQLSLRHAAAARWSR